MPKLMPVAVTNIAANIADRPAYMTFVIANQKYSTARKRTPFILKALSEGAAAHGRVTITTNRVSLADEYGHVFQTLAPLPDVITAVQLGLMRSKTREIGPRRQTKARYTLTVALVTPRATYRCLNTELSVLPALLTWVHDYHLTLVDPLGLANSSFDLPHLTNAQFETLTRDTPYFAWCQTIGSQLN
ncbi:hypothetical protein D1831_10960 [Lactiplantibacillus garii]|uniref:Uncharacterized protein n=1 Tax=Lactiplantibacillus garii TaxID=2306423 RepID=A0A426D5B8_9LACO|nr:hypothetical protein [Lactiplantibacillus garii]RRK09768.1 hypothetical protein D1831_10960 [Lactiplantibacillus garii]